MTHETVRADSQVPLISVVIAAYNSAARLHCAVATVLAQTVSDLEVVVVGDACTDNSEDVLTEFADPRIRWTNLTTNWGEQSVPSNHGIALTRGEFVFFLNQDDLWRPHHIDLCLALLQEEHADVVWSPYIVVPNGGRPGDQATPRPSDGGISPKHPEFSARIFIPASCTAWRRKALHQIGGWRTAAQVSVSPSQDLLWRASTTGLSIRGTRDPTVLVLWSGSRPGSYTNEYWAADNEAWLDALLGTPDVIAAEVAGALLSSAAAASRSPNLVRIIRRSVGHVLRWLCERLKVHPNTWFYIRFLSKGGFINSVRAQNNLGRVDFKKKSKMK